jgi:hypothetical protein
MRRARRERRGTVLVWFALIVFAFLGLAALVIDMGLARLTQRQMQSAVDAAAVEGLRWRDELPPDAGSTDTEQERRERVRAVVADLFADNAGRRYGAGPLIQLSPGVTDLNALQTIESATLFKPGPGMRLNLDDAPHGDMVAGRYENNPAYDGSAIRDEDSGYQRRDFIPSPGGDAFLVRLRRTNDFLGLDNDRDVSSSGPTLPLFFGRGTAIQGADPGTGYSPRHHGITVRATAIADARPVLSAGPPLVELEIPGVAPFGLSRQSWNAWRAANPSATSVTLTYNASGTITGPVTGSFTAPAADVVMIGQPFTPSGSETPVGPLDRYVPVVDTLASVDRVVGFIHIDNAMSTMGNLSFDISTNIASRNATTAVAAALPQVGDDAEVNALFALPETIADVLRAPALVNRHLGPGP